MEALRAVARPVRRISRPLRTRYACGLARSGQVSGNPRAACSRNRGARARLPMPSSLWAGALGGRHGRGALKGRQNPAKAVRPGIDRSAYGLRAVGPAQVRRSRVCRPFRARTGRVSVLYQASRPSLYSAGLTALRQGPGRSQKLVCIGLVARFSGSGPRVRGLRGFPKAM